MTDSYPQHEKLHQIKDKSQCIGDFLDWLEEGGLDDIFPEKKIGPVSLAHRLLITEKERSEYFNLLYLRKEDILAAYFGIDLLELEKEKDNMVKKLLEINK